MLIVWFFAYKKLAQFAVRYALPPRRSESPFAQPTINPLACCICWAGFLGRAVFPPWNEGPNFGSYKVKDRHDTQVQEDSFVIMPPHSFSVNAYPTL